MFRNLLIATLLFLLSYSVGYSSNNKSSSPNLLESQAREFYKVKEQDSALYYFNKSAVLYLELTDLKGMHRCNYAIALIHYYKESFHLMKAILKKNLQILQNKSKLHHFEKRQTIAALGVVYQTDANWDKSIEMLNLSISMSLDIHPLSISDSTSLASDYNNIGIIYSNKGDPSSALSFYRKALDFSPSDQSKQTLKHLASCYNNIAVCNSLLHQFQKMRHFALKSWKLGELESKSFRVTKIDAALILGDYYILHQQSDSAFYYLQKGVELSKIEKYRLNNAYDRMAHYYQVFDDSYNAMNFALLSVNTAKSKYGETHYKVIPSTTILAELLYDQKKFNEAKDVIRFSIQNFTNLKQYNTLKADQLPLSINLLKILRLRALNDFEISNTNDSVRYLQKSIASFQQLFEYTDKMICFPILEETKRILLNGMTDVYEKALSLAFKLLAQNPKKQSYLEFALHTIERSKSTLVLEKLARQNYKGALKMPKQLLQNEKDLLLSMSAHENQWNLAKIDNENKKAKLHQSHFEIASHNYFQFQEKWSKKYPNYFNRSKRKQLPTLHELQTKTDSSTLYLNYFIGKKHLYIWKLHRNSAQLVRKLIPPNFQETLLTYLKSIADYKYILSDFRNAKIEYLQSSSILYDYLIKDELVQKIKHLTIIPDKFLWQIPFESLLTKPTDLVKNNFKDLPFLLKQHSIYYSYSLTILLDDFYKNKTSGSKCLAMTTAQNKEESIRLPGAIAEVKAYEELVSSTSFYGEKATKQQFLEIAQNYDFIHLAMHGKVDTTNPMNSALQFAQNADSIDFELKAFEIPMLTIHSELLTLGACETGSGKWGNGTGVMSLGRSFRYAGVTSTILSLWKLNDLSGSKIFPSFYENLSLNLSKDRALRKAKLNYLNQASGIEGHPFHWAGIVGFGDSKPVTLSIQSNSNRLIIYSFLIGIFLCVGIYFSRKR